MKQLPLDFHAVVGEDSIWADVHALNGIEVHRPEVGALLLVFFVGAYYLMIQLLPE